MEKPWADAFLASKRSFWIVSILTILLFGAANLPWQLDDYDQAKQAFGSFEMIKEGHWLYQRIPDGSIATKPPLVGWISAVTFAITRSWEISWRLPSFAAAFILLALLARSACPGSSATASIIAAAAFGLNLLSPRLASLVRTDMPLALVIFLSGLQIWEKIRTRAEWRPRDRVIQFGLLTAAMLIKGPIVYAFLLPGIALFQWRERKNGKAGGAWSGWWPWLASLSIFLAWTIGGIICVPEFYDRVVRHEFLGRFGETIHRAQPFYFYLPHLIHKFAPWSLVLLAIGIVDLRSKKWRLRETLREMSPETFWLLAWSLGGLAVMSLIPSKRVDRIFPVIPPLCLLLAVQASQWRQKKVWIAAAIIVACLFTSSYCVVKIFTGYRTHSDALTKFGQHVREEAESRHWRYEVLGKRNDGMLLYLRRLRFAEPERVVTDWNAGALDAIVLPPEDADRLLPQLRGASVAESAFVARNSTRMGYVLLMRQ
ncbi:MAG: hypothetical protein QOI04_992 [Verrucomicrobiota bacterium]|jgi:4-amino-4-deoxy-L-arabinose transferase-like glycosyltransferase